MSQLVKLMCGFIVIMGASASVLELNLTVKEAKDWRTELQLMTAKNYDNDTIQAFELQASAALDRAKESFLADPHLLKEMALAPVIRIRGVDFGPIAPTTAGRCKHPSHIPEGVLAGLATKLGCSIVGYAKEKGYTHPWFHDIRPTKEGTAKKENNGKEPLDPHMDMSYEGENAPNYVALAALREGPDPDVTTPFVENLELYKQLEKRYPQDLAVLRNPENWNVQQPLSLGGASVGNMSMLTGEADDPVFWLRVDHKLIHPLNDEAKQTLIRVREVLDSIENHSVHLVSGDVLLVNNRMALHRRSAYKPTFTGEDRLLMRAYFKRTPVPSTRIYS